MHYSKQLQFRNKFQILPLLAYFLYLNSMVGLNQLLANVNLNFSNALTYIVFVNPGLSS